MLVIGEKEVSEKNISIRRQGIGDMGVKSVEEFVSEIIKEIAERN